MRPARNRALAAAAAAVVVSLSALSSSGAQAASTAGPAAAPAPVLRGAAAPEAPGTSARVAPGEPVVISGKGPRRARVLLQRRTGRTWVVSMRQRTDAGGRYAFRFKAPATTTTYRVKAATGRWVSKPRTIMVTPAPPRPSGTLSAPRFTDPGLTVPVTATFTPARPGRAVTLQAQSGDTWSTIATRTEDARGRTVFSVAPERSTTYRAIAARTGTLPAITSTLFRIRTVAERDQAPWVTAYYAGWFWDTGELAPTEIDWDSLTHFVFGRVTPGGGLAFGGEPGTVVPAAGNVHDPSPWAPYAPGSVEDWLVQEAQQHGKEALLMVGGDGEAGRGFVASTATPQLIEDFAENIVDYLVAHDYDGLDLDWENCFGGQAWECGVDITEEDASNRLKALITAIRAEMATRERYAEDPGIITFPGYALNINWLEPGGRAKQWQADVANMVDQFNLMSYGIGTTWNQSGWKSWFSGALDGEDHDGHPISIDSSVEIYERTGVPRSRIGMGIGFYGIYYGPSITGPRQSTADNEIYEVQDAPLAYANLREMGYLTHGRKKWDEAASSTYITYRETHGEGGYVPPGSGRNPAGMLSYEDERSIAAKAEYTWETGLGGTIIWVMNYGELAHGASPLMDAVRKGFIEDPRDHP